MTHLIPQFRILNGLFSHLPLTRSRVSLAKTLTPSSLFQPMILTSRAHLLEIDYNLHKSNSTYFADFDIARLHLMVRLCGLGMARVGEELYLADNKRGPKRIRIGMGGVHLTFRREITFWQSFEMWTKLLCWDRKWFYVVTFFVEKGAVKPKGWTVQPPWRQRNPASGAKLTEPAGKEGEKEGEGEGEKRKGPHPAIFAFGMAKYVCKRGRMTVPPERILQASGLLPPKPKSHSTPPFTDSPAIPIEGDALPTTAALITQDVTSTAADSLIDAALKANPAQGEEKWDWAKVEQERLRGMQIASAWSTTEALGEEFRGDERPALGKWWDWPGI